MESYWRFVKYARGHGRQFQQLMRMRLAYATGLEGLSHWWATQWCIFN